MRQLNLSMEGLIAVVTVAQEGSLERAGQVLGLSKSTMGKQVVIIEAEVFFHYDDQRVPYFNRYNSKKHPILTILTA
jgi:hypothetical protein